MKFSHRLTVIRHVLLDVTTINEVEGVLRKLNICDIHLQIHIRIKQISCDIALSDQRSKFLLQDSLRGYVECFLWRLR